MALQSSGQIKYSEITAEFGAPNTGGLGQYRLDGGEDVGSLTNLPLDSGVPTSGQIKFSDFYSKKLNHIVDLHSIGDNTSRQIAKDRWNNGNVHIVGSSKTGKGQPPNTEDDRVIINVNNIIRSVKGTQTHCALRTGNWDTNTTLEIEIGTSGKLFGSGGDGGTGGNANETAGTVGQTGSSALGIEYPCTINNLGVIQSGYGGGGGGGGNTRTTGGGKKSGATTNGSSGGGGGGGAGLPAGDAGGVQTPLVQGGGSAGSAGQAGSLSGQATGGGGGTEAGDGGDSSPVNNTATKAEDGSQPSGAALGGTGGDNGYAIITNQGSAPSLTGGGSLTGRTITSTNPT
tara:strand:- start:331 stop:1362 length:1032 start_codon:yes stop_codon:yes gene_type:complete